MFKVITEEFETYCINCGTETKFEYEYTEWDNGERTINHERCECCGSDQFGEQN